MDLNQSTKFLSIFFFDEKKKIPLQKKQIEQLKNKFKAKGFPPSLWRKFNKHFQISSYKNLPSSSFLAGLNWIENYSNEEKKQ